jgi:hypothetical protein
MERSGFGRHEHSRTIEKIEFPETISMNKFLDQEQRSQEHRSISVARHIGSDPRRGHDIAFCVLQGQWWKFDDESVKAVPSYAVSDENFPPTSFPPQRLQIASLLLYEIFSPQTPQTARDEYNSSEQNKFFCTM